MSKVRMKQRLVFRVEEFDERMTALGLTTIAEKGRFVSTSQPAMSRIYRRLKNPGGIFVHRVLNAPWPEPVAFEDFFEYEVVAA